MMPLLMFQFTQIQCLCKVTIVYLQSQVSGAIQISRVTFTSYRGKMLAWLAKSFVCLFERSRGLYPMTHSTHGSLMISLFSSPIPLSMSCVFRSPLYLTPVFRFHSDLVWFSLNKRHCSPSPSVINHLFVFLIPQCHHLSVFLYFLGA